MPLLSLLLAACGGDAAYDVDTWNSPLASQFEGEADPAEGERLYFEERWLDDSDYAFTCASCHAVDPADTLTEDADALNRAAHTTWNAAWRGSWKGGVSWDVEESEIIGAYGGQICVTAYFPDGSAMTAEQAAHLEAWMRDNRDATGEAETAQPLDFGFTSWDTADDFVASVQDGAGGWLYGADLGDPAAGEALLEEYCGACHAPAGGGAPVFYTAATADLGTLLARIRATEVAGVAAPNDRMPRLPEDKLPDADLRDLLAALTAGREGT